MHAFIPGHDGHTADVVAMDCHHDNTVVVTGSADSTAKLINTETGKVYIKHWLWAKYFYTEQ